MSIIATPLGFTSTELARAGEEIMAVAVRAYPESAEGFVLGIVIGRLIAEGLTPDEIHGLVEHTLAAQSTVPEASA